jgi:hypothetical protein
MLALLSHLFTLVVFHLKRINYEDDHVINELIHVLETTLSKQKQVTHIKTGNIYNLLSKAINATDAQNGQQMFVYERDGKIYVREVNEFKEKFEE